MNAIAIRDTGGYVEHALMRRNQHYCDGKRKLIEWGKALRSCTMSTAGRT
jgi:hypothetical protein